MSSQAPQAGLLSRSPEEIARVLETIRSRATIVSSHLDTVIFKSLLRRVEAPERVILERSPTEAANVALLARSRCTFHSGIPEWHVEFVATAPRETIHEGTAAIALGFPEVLARHSDRAHPRAAFVPQTPLSCLADANGIMPFDARMINISRGGLGFLVHSADVHLEPGTVLRGCRIELPGSRACVADLEVRYSQNVTLPDGTRAVRSGCRFIDARPEIMELVRNYVKE